MRVFQCVGQRVRGAGDSDEVHVIGHQAVSKQRKAVEFRVLLEKIEISGAVAGMSENDLSGIPPLRNMMRDIGHHYARQTRHAEKIAEARNGND